MVMSRGLSHNTVGRPCDVCGTPLAPNDGLYSRHCSLCRGDAYERLKQRRSKGRIPIAVRLEVIARDGPFCRHCGIAVRPRKTRRDSERDTMELDHLVALVDGGKSTVENLVVSCFLCNRQREGRRRLREKS